MKKLLILAAVIVAGVAANAASFRWTALNVYGSDGTTKFSGTATLYQVVAGGTDVVADTFTTTAAGTISNTFSSDSYVAGTDYSFYFVIEDNGKTFTSDVVTKAAQATSTPTVAFGNMTTATQNASNWSGSAVPEPTSGLLMLLGMAGLALRRRRV